MLKGDIQYMWARGDREAIRHKQMDSNLCWFFSLYKLPSTDMKMAWPLRNDPVSREVAETVEPRLEADGRLIRGISGDMP